MLKCVVGFGTSWFFPLKNYARLTSVYVEDCVVTENLAGAVPQVLHIDITRDKPVDDNAFEAELAAIVENSFNIHQDGDRLIFREEENPQARLIASARNDKLFDEAVVLVLGVRSVVRERPELAGSQGLHGAHELVRGRRRARECPELHV